MEKNECLIFNSKPFFGYLISSTLCREIDSLSQNINFNKFNVFNAAHL